MTAPVNSAAGAVFVDERGVTWTAPTAYAYAMVCQALEEMRIKLEGAMNAIVLLTGALDDARRRGA